MDPGAGGADDPFVRRHGAVDRHYRLRGGGKAQNYRTDYLLFDACFMANIETLYDLRECTDYVIAAPCEIMGEGFPYERAMPWFFTDGGKTRDLTKVCEAFWNFS